MDEVRDYLVPKIDESDAQEMDNDFFIVLVAATRRYHDLTEDSSIMRDPEERGYRDRLGQAIENTVRSITGG